MDQAKVVINIKEGVIELEGPVDFVRHYLDTYQTAIVGLPQAKAAAPIAETKAAPRKTKRAPAPKLQKPKRGACLKAVGSFLEAGFFDQPRAISDVKKKVTETGLACTDSNVRSSLRKLVQASSLGTTGKSRGLRYHKA